MKQLPDIAHALLSGLLLVSGIAGAAGDPVQGKEKSGICTACHGEKGISPTDAYPHLGGQYEDYLLHALRAYKSGQRQDPVMRGMAGPLSDQDLQDLAAYFASLPGVLTDGNVRD